MKISRTLTSSSKIWAKIDNSQSLRFMPSDIELRPRLEKCINMQNSATRANTTGPSSYCVTKACTNNGYNQHRRSELPRTQLTYVNGIRAKVLVHFADNRRTDCSSYETAVPVCNEQNARSAEIIAQAQG